MPKLQAQEKERRSCTSRIISRTFNPTYTTSHLDMWQSGFFTHTDWFYAVNPFCSSLNCCFHLQNTVHRLAVLLTVFWRKKRAKSVSAEKWKSYECRSYLFSVSMKLQFHKTWITLTSNSKMLQIFFSCAYNTIYTFAKFLLRLQILFALAVLCTLSQILPYACKSLWRKITFIVFLLKSIKCCNWKRFHISIYSSAKV